MVFLPVFSDTVFAESFGFNFNVFETNIINLTVVITVVVVFAGNALTSLLNNRKQIIINNYQQVREKILNNSEKCDQAYTNLQDEKKKAAKIRDMSSDIFLSKKNKYIAEIKQKLLRLLQVKLETIIFKQQQNGSEISELYVYIAINKVQKKLNNKFNANFQSTVNQLNSILLANSKL